MQNRILLILLAVLTFTSCRFRPDDRPSWDADYIAPLLHSNMSLADAIKDTNFIQTNPDNSLTLVYRDTVVNFVLGDFLQVPDTSLEMKITLDSLRLSTDSITERITLGRLATEAGLGALFGQYDSGYTPSWLNIPGVQGVSGSPIEINASNFFQEAHLLQGYMDIIIDNQLPVNVDSVRFSLKNKGLYGNTDVIANILIPHIPKGTKSDTTINLAGKTVESLMEAQLLNLNTDTLYGHTYIDTAGQHVDVKVVVRDLGASRATAVFPGQTVVNFTNAGNYDFGPEIKLTSMKIKSGRLKVEAVHSIMDTIQFTYSLPTAVKDGEYVKIITRLDPAPDTNTSVSSTEELQLAGYSLNLTGGSGEFTNKFPQNLKGDLLYSGNLVTMDLQDSITVFYGLLDIIPSYAQGYFGRDTIYFKESVKFDFFKSIQSGTLDLKNPSLQLSFANSLGVDGEVVLNKVKAYNTRSGQTIDLIGDEINDPITIPGPRLPNVGQVISTNVNLNKENSNIQTFLSSLPDSIAFDLQVNANSTRDPNKLDNFATDKSAISAIMDVAVPLYGVADQLTLESNMDLDISEATLADNVNDGRLDLIASNYFPFEATAQIYFHNDKGHVIDSLFHDNDNPTLQAGIVGPDGIVTEPSKSKIGSWFNQDRIFNIRTRATNATVRFSLSTKPANQAVKIYSTYKIEFTLVGDFNYKVGG
ncbi:MAG: hypothetical protein H6581_29425 [Bacteroidia bacterium]|nr:hypothetical protein [Bacteroidia bacterium]